MEREEEKVESGREKEDSPQTKGGH